MNTTGDLSGYPPWDGKRDHTVLVFCTIGASMAVTVVALRLYVRSNITKFRPDDWAIIPAVFLMIGHTACACYANERGHVGKPLWEVSYEEYSETFKMIVVSSFLYPIMTSSIRLSILLFYRRLIGPTNPRMNQIIKGLMFFIIPYALTFIFIASFTCRPFRSAWQPYVRNRDCGDIFYYRTTVALYSISLTFDFTLLMLPCRTIWELKMPKRQRLGVLVIVALGASACAAVGYRLAVFVLEMRRFYHIDPRWAANPLRRVIPPQFDTYGLTYWIPGQIEACLGIIGASLPAVKPLVMKAASKFSRNRSDGSGSGGKSHGSSRQAFQRQHHPRQPSSDSVEALNNGKLALASSSYEEENLPSQPRFYGDPQHGGAVPSGGEKYHMTTIKSQGRRNEEELVGVGPRAILQTSTIEVSNVGRVPARGPRR